MRKIDLLIAYGLVFLLSAIPLFEAYIVIPLGIAGGLNPLLTLIIGLVGNILTVFLVAIFVEQFKNWMSKRKKSDGEKESKRNKRTVRLFKKYGIPGLAFLGPLFAGSHLTTMAVVSVGGTQKSAFLWVSFGITVWAILFSVLVHFGFDILGIEKQQFISKYLKVD